MLKGDKRVCDFNRNCESCWDEASCLWTREEVNTTRERLIAQGGGLTGSGALCKNVGNWEHLSTGDGRSCDLKCDCDGCWDEASCPWMETMNTTREQLIENGGGLTGEGTICKQLNKWEYISTGDNRTCDLKCDCDGCWDETLCPWMANLNKTRGQLI